MTSVGIVNFSEFHFLRPEWLWAFPALLLVYLFWLRRNLGKGNWSGVCDDRLLPYIVEQRADGDSRLPRVLFLVACGLAVIALAGPAWKQLPVPVYRNEAALVLAVDLSRSMDAQDVKPSRLERARYKISDILAKRRDGLTALVVYSNEAYTVTPLTHDSATISSQLSALETSIMPAQGSQPGIAVRRAADLLQQAGNPGGYILLITDEGTDGAVDMARTVKSEGHRVSVLGVGTEQGAPIPESGGGFVKDASGNVVVPRLDTDLLESIAQAGGGLYRTMTLQDHDIEAFLEAIDAIRELPQEQQHAMQADRWVEEGPWLFWLILPIAAFAFRRGYLFGWLVLFLPLPNPVHAWQWDDLWQNPDQRAYQAYQQGGYSEAADLFEDPEWKAASEYAAGRYQRAVETLDEVDSGDNAYNKGNALARSGRFGEALEQYDRALELDPDDQDALYNRKLVKRLLQQQKQQGPQRPDTSPASQQKQHSASADGQQPDTASDSFLDEMKDGSQNQSSTQRQAERDKKTGDAAREPSDEPDSMADGLAEAGGEDLAGNMEETPESELQKADEQWLRRIPDDPAGLLRRKFRYQYKKRSRQPASAGEGW